MSLELSTAQIEEVVRAAHEAAGLPLAVSLLGDVDRVVAFADAHLHDRALSRSLIAGFLVLACFPPDGGELGNSEIAAMLDISPSSSHRYVSTLLALGLIERDPNTRRYRRVPVTGAAA